jgi:hypothetical protein
MECKKLSERAASKLDNHYFRRLGVGPLATGFYTLPPALDISAIYYGDFNQDGKTDILVKLVDGAGLLLTQIKNPVLKHKDEDSAFFERLSERDKISPSPRGPNDVDPDL